TFQLEGVSQAINRAQQDKIFVESNLNEELAGLRAAQADNPNTIERKLALLQQQLAALQPRYTDQNPDVFKIKNEIARLQEKLQEEAKGTETANPGKTNGENLWAEKPELQQMR